MAAAPPTPGVDMDEKRLLITTQLTQLTVRIHLMAKTITLLYVAIGLLVGTSIAIGIDAFFNWQFSAVPVLSGLGGGCMLFWGSVLLVREARLAVAATVYEMNYVRRIVAKHTPAGH